MKILSSAAKNAYGDGSAIEVGALRIDTPPPIRIWGGNGPINLPGENAPFLPLPDRSLVSLSGGALGASAQAITLSLSGIDPEAIQIDDSADAVGVSAALWKLVFAGDGVTLLDALIWRRGRCDKVERLDEVGGTATISVTLEGAAKALGRSGARYRSDADQRLVSATDGFFRNVSYAGEKTLYWGGRMPSVASVALGGSYGGGSSGGGLGGILGGWTFNV